MGFLASNASAGACAAATFSSLPPLFGIDIVNVAASVVSNYSAQVSAANRFTSPAINVEGVSFCNVTISYTHPRTDDLVNVESWLPISDEWNQIIYASGGGGLVSGGPLVSYPDMSGALAEGYAVVTTDAGVGTDMAALDGSSWVLRSPGNINLQLAQNFGTSSLEEMARLTKSVVKTFYGKEAKRSYFNGCSSGGRQGLMLAQRYPQEFDGIMAGAPGINMALIISNLYWPQQIMNELKEHPPGCEVNAIVEAAIQACDELDGVADGIISEPKLCGESAFDPFAEVDKEIDCAETGSKRKISHAAAQVANATWQGMATSYRRQLYYGLYPGANLTSSEPGQGGVAGTTCTTGGHCKAKFNQIGSAWLRLFGFKDASANVDQLSREDFQRLALQTEHETASLFNSDEADLTAYRNAGGKLLTWHGLADDTVPAQGTEEYYLRVKDQMPDVDGFYKHYEVPGAAHCACGPKGGQMTALFKQLRAWVEDGTAPGSSPVTFKGKDGQDWNRIVCPYPQKAVKQDGCEDLRQESCWKCQ